MSAPVASGEPISSDIREVALALFDPSMATLSGHGRVGPTASYRSRTVEFRSAAEPEASREAVHPGRPENRTFDARIGTGDNALLGIFLVRQVGGPEADVDRLAVDVVEVGRALTIVYFGKRVPPKDWLPEW